MLTNRPALALALALVIAPPAFADLLDDDEPVTKPQPPQQPKTETQPSDMKPPSHPGNLSPPPGPATAPAPEPTKTKGPSPHPKTQQTTSTTTVIPPKNAGRKAKAKKEDPVHFDSKGLKGLRDKGMVELVQDVVVTQGEMRMEADHAQVFFDEGAKDKKDRGLIKVIADGNPVKIYGVDENSGDKFRAFGNQAVFLNKERTVVLEGNARLWRGDDSVVRSKKITYEMNTGWIRADKVAGEVVPSDKPATNPGAGNGKEVGDPDAATPASAPAVAPKAPTLPAPAPVPAPTLPVVEFHQP